MSDDLESLFNRISEKVSNREVDIIPEGWFSANQMQEKINKSMTHIRNILKSSVKSGILECEKFSVCENGKRSSRMFYHEKDSCKREETKKRKGRRNADRE